MPSHVKYELTATVGTYQKNGEEKKRYQRCGTVFENEKGQLSVKLECIPTTPEWNGWFSCFEPRQENRNPMGGVDRSAAEAIGEQPAPQDDDSDSEIPF